VRFRQAKYLPLMFVIITPYVLASMIRRVARVQDKYDGDLQQNEYGWNWKERFNGNNQEGPQLGGYPCGQQGWCCKLIGKRCKLH